jgi:hypothetical protein
MDFAADAVFDVAAPPSRPANARPAPARNTSEPSFDDHLEAATAEEAPREERAKPADGAKASDDADVGSEAPAVEADAAPPTEPPAPSHIIQIVAPPPPAPVAGDAAGANSARPQTAPIEAAPAPRAPAPAAPIAAPVASPSTEPSSAESEANAEPLGSKADAAKSAAAVAAAAVGAQQGDTAEANAVAPQTPTPAQTGVIPAQAPAPLPTTETPPPDLAMVAAPPAPVEHQAPTPQRTGRADTQRGAKSFEAVVEGGKAEAPPVNAAQTQKTAPSTPAGKDAASSLLALQADAPEIPAPMAQQGGTPLAQTTAPTQQTASVDHTAAVRATPAAAQVAREIVRRFDGDNTTFDLRLDPPELGRVEVRLDVSRDHRVTAVISADSPQALAELARNARELEQMLNDAGLQLSDSGLSFDLRQGSEGNADASETNSRGRSAESGDDAPQQQAPIAARPLGFERWRGVRVDVTV